ncbi:MAG: hypothetical protein LLG40_12570 [Deltaproteobacteria bacterium]|nr:hypothetical protein [Deltaproteobacteria bacterium]
MNDNNSISHFRDLVAQFKEKEQCFIKALLDNDLENPVLEAIYSVAVQIKEELGEYDVLKVDDLLLRNDLCAIRENRGFKYFKVLELLGIEHVPAELSFERTCEIRDEIFNRVSPYAIITRKMEIGALLVGKIIPNRLIGHLTQIKECYIWGFDSAATIYCRTILEEGFRETLKSKPEFNTPQQRKDLEGWSLDWLLKHSKNKRYFDREVLERAYKIKENVNHIVHPTRVMNQCIQMPELEIIKETFYILEMLFR